MSLVFLVFSALQSAFGRGVWNSVGQVSFNELFAETFRMTVQNELPAEFDFAGDLLRSYSLP